MLKKCPREESSLNEKVIDLGNEILERRDFVEGRKRWSKFYYKKSLKKYPTLHVDDFSGIPFISNIPGIEWYQLRSRVRAENGDFYLSSYDEIPSYEEYNREYLNIGQSECLRVKKDTHPFYIAKSCMGDKLLLSRLKEVIRNKGGLLIHPYMGVDDVWELAEMLERETGGEVGVLAPPPHVTKFANDKKEFCSVVTELLGSSYLPETYCESALGRIVERIKKIHGGNSSVVLKIKNCASAMGNRLFKCEELKMLDDSKLENEIKIFLGQYNIELPYEILITKWEENVVSSPSSQLWITSPGEKTKCEGLYDQILTGDGVFAGSIPSSLPKDVQDDFESASLLLTRLFQHIDYRGRCSFDSVVTRDKFSSYRIKFVECNGRWGGTSIPMYLFKKIFFQNGRAVNKNLKTYIAVDYTDTRLKGHDFIVLKNIMKDHLFHTSTGKGNLVLYNAGCLKEFGKFDIIIAGKTKKEVKSFLSNKIPALIDNHFS